MSHLGKLKLQNTSIISAHDNWWKESAMMILRRQIRFVRMTLTPNPGGYPAMYRKLERIK